MVQEALDARRCAVGSEDSFSRLKKEDQGLRKKTLEVERSGAGGCWSGRILVGVGYPRGCRG